MKLHLAFLSAFGSICLGTSLQPLLAQGSVVAWGWDDYGQVSDAPAGDDFVQVTGGQLLSMALRADGSLEIWGRNEGSGVVAQAPTGTGFTQIACGLWHALALRSDSTIHAWGAGYDGQVSDTPSGAGFVYVASGRLHSLVIHEDGYIVAWGLDNAGQVSGVPQGNRFVQVAGGAEHSLALRQDGSIAAWGLDSNGQVSNTPTGRGFVQIAAASNYSQALHEDGSIVTWGSDWGGVSSNTPSGTGFAQIALGGVHALTLRSDGSLFSWGNDIGGQIVDTPPGTGFIQVASGGNAHSLAIRASNVGAAYCFGDGTGANCPCSTNGNPGEGCGNTGGLGGARLTGSGLALLAGDSFQLQVTGAPSGKPGLILRGASSLGGDLGIAVGDGLLCVTGQTARSQVQITSAGNALFTDFQGSPFGTWSYGAGVAVSYQFWYRDSTNPCSGSGFNFSNAWVVSWMP